MICSVVMETLSVFALVMQHHSPSILAFFISNSDEPDTFTEEFIRSLHVFTFDPHGSITILMLYIACVKVFIIFCSIC